MNAILYSVMPGKKINGTLFYCFEYFIFLKQYVVDLKYFIIGEDGDIAWFKAIFTEKYSFDHAFLADVLPITRTQLATTNLTSLMVLDVRTYGQIRHFTRKIPTVRVYSDKAVTDRDNPQHVFYGWYDQYQTFDKKARLKFFVERHNTYTTRGNKVFVSSLNGNNGNILAALKLNPADVYVKVLSSHNSNMFENINKIIYWHAGSTDTNNRIVVEAYIHNIPLELHLNGNTHDSIYERAEAIKRDGLSEFSLSLDDVLIKDFLEDCK